MMNKKAVAKSTIVLVLIIVILAAGLIYYATLPPPTPPPTPTPSPPPPPPPGPATITGKVVDTDTGAPIAGATVTADGYRATTGPDGVYALSVKVGAYSVKVTMEGYEPKTASVSASEEKSYTIDASLKPTMLAPIKIGFMGPVSPPGAYSAGIEMKLAAEMGVEEINKRGGLLGRTVELIVVDNMGLPEKATAAMEKLITMDKVVAVTGEYHSSCGLAAIEVANKYGVPFVIADASMDEITTKGYEPVFRVGAYSSAFIDSIFGFMKPNIEAGKIHTVGVLIEDFDWGQSAWKLLKPRLDEAGIKYKAITIDRTAVDFIPQLLELKSMEPRPEMLLTLCTGGANFIFVKQAYEIGFAPTLETPFALDGSATIQFPEYWEVVGEAGNYWSVRVETTPQFPFTEIGDQFRTTFMERYKLEPCTSAFEEYDCILAVADAIERAESTDPDKMIKALEETKLLGTRFVITFETVTSVAGEMIHQTPRFSFICQYQELNQLWEKAPILYPKEYATGELKLPGG